jgi:uncharacterized protein
MTAAAHIYVGDVVHKRLRPTTHALRYRVFNMLVDVDRIADVAKASRLFSYNRFNLFSLRDSDYGAGDSVAIADFARRCLRSAGRPSDGRTIWLLTYPRVLGYSFNPLSVYFVHAPDQVLESVIYEVSNTFGERVSYVLAAGAAHDGGVFAHTCAKEMFVSPFAEGRGRYSFRLIEPDAHTLVAVLFSDRDGALIKTHFKGQRQPFKDTALAGLALRFPLLTLKVIGAIHWEALKLWIKGVPLADRQKSPRYVTRSTEHSTPVEQKG